MYTFLSWVSGVTCVRDPTVWACLHHYTHCSGLGEKVRGDTGGWLCLLYPHGHAHPALWEVSEDVGSPEFVCSVAESTVEVSWSHY